jgi:hypothetical protein
MFLLMLSLLAVNPPADSNKSQVLSLAAGPAWHHRYDQNVGALWERSRSWSMLQFDLTTQKKTQRQHFSLSGASFSDPSSRFPFGFNDTVITAAAANFVFLRQSFELLQQLQTPIQLPKIWLGGYQHFELGALFHGHAFSTFGYLHQFHIGLAATMQQALGKKCKLEASLQFPLLLWVARSPYALNDDDFIQRQSSHNALRTLAATFSDGGLAAPWQYPQMRLEASGLWQISARFQLGILWRYWHQQSKQMLPLAVNEQAIMLKGGWKW